MLLQGQQDFAKSVLVGDMANPMLPMLIARIKRVIARLSTEDGTQLGGQGMLAYVGDHARLEPLAIDTQAAEWRAGAVVQDGRPMLRIEASLSYSGDRGLLPLLAANLDDEAAVTVAMTDTRLVVAATGAVEDPDQLIGPVNAVIDRIARVVAIQAHQVDDANACAAMLAASQLSRRTVRSGLVARH